VIWINRRFSIPTVLGHVTGLKPNQLTRLEHLYRRRVPSDKIITPELARHCTQLAQEIRRPIGLLITRRGVIEQVLVGDGCMPSFRDLAKFRAGPRSLRGIRLVRAQLDNAPLSQSDLTQLALLRLDLIATLGAGKDGGPADIHVAHLLPPNPRGQVHAVLAPTPLQSLQLECDKFVAALEAELMRTPSGHAVGDPEESAILVSASPRNRSDQEDRLEELSELAASAGVRVLDKIIQRTSEQHQRFLLGSGKLKEVIIRALHCGADLLIFDQNLTPAQVRAISEITEMKVIDRTQLILDIFARRAHSREGKVQVELAQLRYLLPRLLGRGAALSRLGGGIGARGPGETKLETDRRRVRDRIAHLERELSLFARHQDQRRARRLRHGLPIVSIVGYTNAGKSTLLNVLTKSQVSVQDRQFETLDTTSRRLRFPRDRDIIITDTVGFIRDLPQELMGAFRTTLEELHDADMLLHLVDASAKDVDGQMAAVQSILAELRLDHIPRVVVLNKCDRLSQREVALLCRRYNALAISAIDPTTLPPLIDYLDAHVANPQLPWSEQTAARRGAVQTVLVS
jgi:GTP-binding protein HflX